LSSEMRNSLTHEIVSLPRALSKLGYCSRSQAVELIEDGKVCVNGTPELDIRRRVSLISSRISVDDRIIGGRKNLIYLCLNKPRGVVTTRIDERGTQTVYDLLGKQPSWIFPVGRLDKESSGLLLFTNDSEFGERLTDPGNRHPKTYRVKIDRPISDNELRELSGGVVLKDGYTTLPAKVKRDTESNDGCSFSITLIEGKNRQIRRMCEALGYDVIELHRSRIGRLSLDDLDSGKWRLLTQRERNLALTR
jgi:23S rRNA pseudouridine2605 synthase